MIGILTDPGIGGTFLTWSVYYLRGDKSYFLAEQNKQLDLTVDPFNGMNAHNFIPNQPNRGIDQGLEKLYNIVQMLMSKSNEVIYLHNFDNNDDTKLGVDYLSVNANKLILLTGKKYPLYQCRYIPRSGGSWISQLEYSTDPDDIYKSFVNKFFADSYQKFQDLKLTNVWDQREFIALNFKPYKQSYIEDCFDHTTNHYVLDITEVYNIDTHIIFMFDYLNLKINNDRYSNWQQIYRKWQAVHHQPMLFSIYFDQIINSIINGYNLDLTRFNLDIVQEATIQYELIYKHNLNLKTWQLEKFTNTKQLHNLLEPNIHPITTY